MLKETLLQLPESRESFLTCSYHGERAEKLKTKPSVVYFKKIFMFNSLHQNQYPPPTRPFIVSDFFKKNQFNNNASPTVSQLPLITKHSIFVTLILYTGRSEHLVCMNSSYLPEAIKCKAAVVLVNKNLFDNNTVYPFNLFITVGDDNVKVEQAIKHIVTFNHLLTTPPTPQQATHQNIRHA